MYKKYVVRLTDQERNELQRIIKKLKGPAKKSRHRLWLPPKGDCPGAKYKDLATDFKISQDSMRS